MLGTLIVGMLAGLAARMLHPSGRVTLPAGVVFGALGAVAAFYGGRALHWFTDGQMAGWFAGVAGAGVLVGIWGLARRR
ncbi:MULTISPECIES: GlsB/YeaQ/YmgE family stress response membrane protein [Cupriavidus]